MGHVEREMPKYRCHKEVHALQIDKVEDGFIFFKDQDYGRVQESGEFFDRTRPSSGDYYVVYSDGYTSISPPEAFESGYTRI